MVKLNKADLDVLKNIYKEFEEKSEITVSSSNYKKTVIDYFVNHGLLTKLDASTLIGWTYIIRPTHEGELTVKETINPNLSKVESFIEQGYAIMKEEYHHAKSGIAFPDYISGPKSDQWFNEISIFNSQILINHPLHDQIAEVCKTHKRSLSAHEDMMGYLKALASDSDFWREPEPKEKPMKISSRKTIEQMLADDIERCEEYLNQPSDEAYGKKLYVEITSKYDSIIRGFGNGLYQYLPDIHFYDPEIDSETLLFNLRVLKGKMIAYQATHSTISTNNNISTQHKKYDVFISHANIDKINYVNELKQSLDKLKINVFYDKDTLEWGDNWKDRILEGVDKSEFAIIVISNNYFGREWTEKELYELLNRQNSNGQKIILPILHKISVEQLRARYPEVADIQALNSEDYSYDEIALKFACQLIKRLKA